MKIPIAKPYLGQKELSNVIEAVVDGWISSKGKFIEEFEQKFADYCGVKYGVATNSGTAALHLALTALGIGPGDEVVVPALTYIATADAVTYTGAKPVFVDVDEYHWGIDTLKIQEKITSLKTKAIIPVYLYGHPPEMVAIRNLKFASDYSLKVIEDAAEAHGAEFNGYRAGHFGDIGCFSFYGNKIITTGEGGMCVTDGARLADEMRHLRNAAMVRPYIHNKVGFNYNMTNLQAAIGSAQVDKLDEIIEKKRWIASWYADALKPLADKGQITLHPEAGWAKCVYWLYSILIKETAFGMSRDQVMEALAEKGIETRPFFSVIPYLPHYHDVKTYPVAERLSNEGMNLPSYPQMTVGELEYVTNAIKELAK
jgi:perosamine synthetase